MSESLSGRTRSWVDLIADHLWVGVPKPKVYCSTRVTIPLLKVVRELRYAIAEAFTRPDVRTVDLIHLYASVVRVLAECYEELADLVAGLSDAEIYESGEVASVLDALARRYLT